jgi:hypothetical protein
LKHVVEVPVITDQIGAVFGQQRTYGQWCGRN